MNSLVREQFASSTISTLMFYGYFRIQFSGATIDLGRQALIPYLNKLTLVADLVYYVGSVDYAAFCVVNKRISVCALSANVRRGEAFSASF